MSDKMKSNAGHWSPSKDLDDNRFQMEDDDLVQRSSVNQQLLKGILSNQNNSQETPGKVTPISKVF